MVFIYYFISGTFANSRVDP